MKIFTRCWGWWWEKSASATFLLGGPWDAHAKNKGNKTQGAGMASSSSSSVPVLCPKGELKRRSCVLLSSHPDQV